MKILKARLWELERIKVQRIRTYNYPQDRITDHRVNETWHGIEDLMTGDILEQMHEALLENEQFLAIEDALADAEDAPSQFK
jgi:protein subunit release factor A